MLSKNITLLLFILLILASCKSDDTVLIIDKVPKENLGSSFVVDETNALILYNGASFALGSTISLGSETLTIETEDATLQKGKGYSVTYKGSSFMFFRTELPIVSLNTQGQVILNDTKIQGQLRLLETGIEPFENLIGIKLRGGVSRSFPKKSYSMELWLDAQGTSLKESLLDLRNDDDWILDGLWNEPLRLRDYVCHDLWLKIGRHPYKTSEPNSIFGIKKKFCEVFLNGKYKGVYYLGEKIDRKQLNLVKFDTQLNGELYKGSYWDDGVTFDGLESFTNSEPEWSGYEAKYPEQIGELDWSNLHSLVDFVVNSNQSLFDASISNLVDMANMADYYIFMNIIYATDNRGKNVYTGRYDQNSPYFFLPWDMDGSFGTDWRGERTDITTKMLSNGLYDKLLQNGAFKAEVKSRWNTLKANELSIANLQSMFNSNYAYLKDNGVYNREALDPELPQFYNEQEIGFINKWVESRFNHLDSYFENL